MTWNLATVDSWVAATARHSVFGGARQRQAASRWLPTSAGRRKRQAESPGSQEFLDLPRTPLG